MWTLDALEQQLRTSIRTWGEFAGRRRARDRLLAEYHRGLATGIYITLGATGHGALQERIAREALQEDGRDEAFLAGLFIGTGLGSA